MGLPNWSSSMLYQSDFGFRPVFIGDYRPAQDHVMSSIVLTKLGQATQYRRGTGHQENLAVYRVEGLPPNIRAVVSRPTSPRKQIAQGRGYHLGPRPDPLDPVVG